MQAFKIGDHKQVLGEPCSELSALISGPEKSEFSITFFFFFFFSYHLSPHKEALKPVLEYCTCTVPTSIWATRVRKI